MTTEQIQAALAELVTAMMGKGIVTPSAQLWISAHFPLTVYLKAGDDCFERDNFKFINAETDNEVFAAARAYIDAMPSPEQAIITRHMGLLAAVVDHGREHSLPDEYVVPAQVALQAMTDNLLTVVK